MYGIQEDGYFVGDSVVLALRNTRKICGTAVVKAIHHGNRMLLEPIAPEKALATNPKILVVSEAPPQNWDLLSCR